MERLLEFAGNHPYLVAMAAALLVMIVVNELKALTSRGFEIDAANAVQLMNAGATVVDLRTVERYRAGHIINAVHVPFEDLQTAATEKLAKYKDKPVLLYDDVGTQGSKGAKILRQLSFTQAANLRGGLSAWQRDNMPLVAGK